MPKPIQDMSSWSPSTSTPSRPPADDEAWQATRQVGPATQLVGDKEDYLASAARDIGRNLGDGQWELFVVCDPGEAMHQQFDHLAPEYIAIHDVAATASRRLLAGLAVATASPVQKLTIRRQGHGVALATIEFVELPATGSPPLRVYSTEVDADTTSRRELARVLLAHSRLGVMLVGDLPPHALTAALDPLQKAILSGGWPNRHLLMLPLSSASLVYAQGAQFAHGSGVTVRTTPQVRRPAEAWSFISGSWNRLREQVAVSGTTLPMLGPVAPQATTPAAQAVAPAAQPVEPAAVAGQAPAKAPAPLPMREMPPIAAKAEPESRFAAYVEQCSEIKGMVSCCVFEIATQRPLAHAGARPGPAVLAAQGARLFEAIVESGRQLGLGQAQPDAAITLTSHHVLLRPLPHHPGVALHAVLERSVANLTLVRLQLQRLDATLETKG